MISVYFQGKPFNITVIQVYAPTSNAEEAEAGWYYEDLQDLLELTPKKDILFIIGDWNAKVGSQEIPGITGKFGLGVQNEAVLPRERTGYSKHPLPTTQEKPPSSLAKTLPWSARSYMTQPLPTSSALSPNTFPIAHFAATSHPVLSLHTSFKYQGKYYFLP